MASIQKVGEKWRAQVAKMGVRKSAVWDTRREAVRWAERIEAEIAAGLKPGRTFGAAVDHYEKTVSAHKRDPAWESRRFAAMTRHFGEETPLGKLDSEAIGHWRDARLKTVSGSTVQRESNLLRHLFTLACDEWRWIDRNPFKGVRLPKHNPPRHQVWTWPLIRRVLRAQRSDKTAETIKAFRVSLHTALRLSEVLAGKYDPVRKVFELERTKTGGRATVPLTRRAAKLFPVTFTVGPNEASTLFSKLCKELLIEDLTFHDARATALTLMARRMDILTLSRISRHRDLRILSQTYYRESAEQISARI